MSAHRMLSILLLYPALMQAQQLPSINILQSGIMLGTGRERYYSLRIEALGTDFSGIVPDRLTDLFRNPAYYDKLENPLLFGEMARIQNASSTIVKYATLIPRVGGNNSSGYPGFQLDQNVQVYIYPDGYGSTGTPVGIRLGYAGKLGIFVRGNYFNSSSDQLNDVVTRGYPPYQSSYYQSVYGRDSRSDWGDAQLSYAFQLGEGLSAGLSYTFGLSESPGNTKSFTSYWQTYFNPSTSYYDSAYGSRYSFSNAINKIVSHTLRGGILWEGEAKTIDVVGTVEILRSDINIRQGQDESYYNFHRSSPNDQPTVADGTIFQNLVTYADIEGTNARIAARYLNRTDPSQTFSLQAGASLGVFNSDDRYYNSRSYVSNYMSTSDTSKNSSYYLTARYGSPDGVGLQANANAGWTFTMSDFLVAAGVGANLLHLNFDYDAQRTLLDDAYQLSHQVGMSLRHYTEDNRFLHKQNVTTVRLAVPLGLEYELVKHCHVRAGWVAEFLRTANEDKSTENGFDVTSNQINLSTVTFGMGYQIFEKLRADFVNVGDIAQPRNWNLSAIYTFGAAE